MSKRSTDKERLDWVLSRAWNYLDYGFAKRRFTVRKIDAAIREEKKLKRKYHQGPDGTCYICQRKE